MWESNVVNWASEDYIFPVSYLKLAVYQVSKLSRTNIIHLSWISLFTRKEFFNGECFDKLHLFPSEGRYQGLAMRMQKWKIMQKPFDIMNSHWQNIGHLIQLIV